MSAKQSRLRLFQQHLQSLVWVWVWVWDWIHWHTSPLTRSPSSLHHPFTQYSFSSRSLVCGGPSPHKSRLVISHSTCSPRSSSPHAHSFVLGTAVINNNLDSFVKYIFWCGLSAPSPYHTPRPHTGFPMPHRTVTGFPMSSNLSRLRLFQRHLRSLVWVSCGERTGIVFMFFSLFAFSSGFTRGGLVTQNISSLPGLAFFFCNQLAYCRLVIRRAVEVATLGS
jgi:hypothetical protein